MKTVKTINTDEKEYGWVFYDGACRFCRRLARQWEPALERRLFRMAPLQEPWVAARLGIHGPELLREMRVLNPQGKLFGGAEGFVELSRAFWWARWLAAVARIPGGLKLMKRAYRWMAARRHCDTGACAIVRGTIGVDLLPLLILTAAAACLTVQSPGWLRMWSVAAALFAGVKWLAWRGASLGAPASCRREPGSRNPSSNPAAIAPAKMPAFPGRLHCSGSGFWRTAGFFALWPGMDARHFLDRTRGTVRARGTEWFAAFAKTSLGAVAIWIAAGAAMEVSPLLAGWTGMIGLVLFLHFGVFHLLSMAWRAGGVDAAPIMNAPLRAVSLTEFWGRRWNLGFSAPARQFLYRPLASRFGNARALMGVFVVSGVIHELVISFPAGAGFGLPTAYFALQGVGMLVERSAWGRRFGLGSGWRGWGFTMCCAGAPAYWLFHPAFVDRVILPFLQTIGAL